MTVFHKPQDTPTLGQGDFNFLPAVKGFGPHPDPQDLETEINLWIVSFIPNPDFTIDIRGVQYQVINMGANTEHTALVHYFLIEGI